MPRRGTRSIVVDDTEYRWHVRGKLTDEQYMGDAPMTFAVEIAEGAGAVLVVELPVPHSGAWMEPGESSAVTPGLVASVIRSALAAGWRPAEAGPAVTIPAP